MRIRRHATLAVAALAAAGLLAAGAVGLRRVAALRARAALVEARWQRLLRDPAGLARYRADNARLRAAGRVPGRVVFLGASITEEMDLARLFPGAPFVNRGIGGQRVWQQLLRMPDDVFALEPDAVVIKACATNLEGDAPPVEQTEAALLRMADWARARGVRPVWATVVPVSRAYARAAAPVPLAARIDQVNRWIRAQTSARGDALLDYAAALADAQGYLPEALTADGLHPNAAGYARMAAVVRATLLAPGRGPGAREEAAR